MIRYWAGTHPSLPRGSRTAIQSRPSDSVLGPSNTITVLSGQANSLSPSEGEFRIYTPSPSVFPTRASCKTGVNAPSGVASATAVAVASRSGVGVHVGVPVLVGCGDSGACAG